MDEAAAGGGDPGPVGAGDTVVVVHGEGRREVPPDAAVITCSVAATSDTRAGASGDAADALAAVTAALAALGGVPARPAPSASSAPSDRAATDGAATDGTARARLAWSARSVVTEPEQGDLGDGWGPTGRHAATVALTVTVRDTTLLGAVGDALVGATGLDRHGVDWLVDADNPAWPAARVAAVRDAVARARDLAGALGGRLTALDRLADGAGGERPPPGIRTYAANLSAPGAGASPALDPVPQELLASVEARFTASGLDPDAA